MREKLLAQYNIRSLFATRSVQYLFAARNTPHRAIIVSNRSGNYQLHAVDFRTGFHRQITNAKHGALFGSISSDGQQIYILSDPSGAEHGHFLCLPFEGGHGVDVTPSLKPYFSYSVNTSDDGETLSFTAALDNKNKVFIVRKNKSGEYHTRELYSVNTSLSEPICAPDGSVVCVAETNMDTGKSQFVFLSTAKGARVVHSRQFNDVMPLTFSRAQNKKIILTLVRYNNWYRPAMYDITLGRATEIYHSLFRGDVWALSWDEARHQLVLCDIYRAEQKLYIYNTQTKRLKRIGPKTGSFNFHFGSTALRQDGSLLVRWSDFNTSPRLIAVHAPQYDTWSEILEWSGDVSSHYVAKNIRTKSSDGEQIQMWVARPHGTKTPIPFVIDVHGGPHGATLDEFSSEAHAWLKNGFGYCAVNYRGSIGFGRKFERKIYGNPGHWEVEDVVAARNWLVRNEYADPKYITIYGWSWGGYITLFALGTYPNLWSVGIACAGIADCVAQYEDEPAYFRTQDEKRFRGTPETAHARYVRSSPITYVDHIQSPLLILHGKYDVRCPPRQMRRFIDALKKNKKRFDIEWFESGHTGEFTDTNLRIRLIDKAIRFALSAKKK
jgi:dipeptidyl aminopeptidase/acylaminoacyl peptidase